MVDVLIISGSKSDGKIVEKATRVLIDLGVEYEVKIASAHREPDRVREIVRGSDARVFIAVAGLAAALPGFVASLTEKPVIGVPVSAALDGLDALLSMAQMPKGVPVATVGIDNGQNAAYLAARILGVQNKSVQYVPRTYAEAGIDEGEVADGLSVLARYVKESFTFGEVSHDFGQYANMVKIGDDLFIALATDGVGSKVLIAEEMRKFNTIGIDCVAMNVNDLICVGATPVGFVDYLASEKPLGKSVIGQIGEGLLEGCRQSEIPILGGETAILPDMIRGVKGPGLDLAGTAVGVSREREVIDGSTIAEGDAIIGIESNGIHSNGFTLARRVLRSEYSYQDTIESGVTLGEELLRPTRIYVPHFKALRDAGVAIKGLSHITGSGFRKVLRLGEFQFDIAALPDTPPIFSLIQSIGDISWSEMFTTFNMGIGLVVVVAPDDLPAAKSALENLDQVYVIGHIATGGRGMVRIPEYEVTIK